jgi:LPS O-antigen subunit length determinant protein (WzzB/FepE family)
VDFEDAVPLSEVVDSYQYVRSKVLDEAATTELVEQLDAGDNVLEECLSEVERLKKQSWNSNSPSRSDGC